MKDTGDKPERSTSEPSEQVPKLPRGRLFAGVRPIEFIRIGAVALMLVVIVVAGRPCADSVATFIESFAPPPDAGPAVAPPAIQYERLTEDEIRRRFGDWEDASPGAESESESESESETESESESESETMSGSE